MNTWTEVGKGRKQCPKCNIYVGSKTATCKCGHIFAKGKAKEKQIEASPKKEPKEQPVIVDYEYTNYVVLSTPSGECPFKLASTKENDIREWIGKLVEHHLKRGEKLRPEAVTYYVRHFYSVFEKKHKTVCDTIELIKNEVNLYV